MAFDRIYPARLYLKYNPHNITVILYYYYNNMIHYNNFICSREGPMHQISYLRVRTEPYELYRHKLTNSLAREYDCLLICCAV